MKIKHPLRARCSRRSASAIVLVLLAVVVVFWPQNASGQQPSLPKLTLSQIEQLVSHGVPDSTMAGQIRTHGITFTPTPAILDDLRAKGAGPLTLSELRNAMARGSLQQRPSAPQAKQPMPKPAATATLLVLCDLACIWKLDGETKGRIGPDGTAKVSVDFGQHVLVATTEDGVDRVQVLRQVDSAGQTVVTLELKPVRAARLQAEDEAQQKAADDAREKAAREEQEQEQRQREEAMREDAAQPTWSDAATGLMWTKKDNGYDISWPRASAYCSDLRLAGYSDWRLPTIDELMGIYDSDIDKPGVGYRGARVTWHVKGNLSLTGWHWSSTVKDTAGDPWHFGLYFGAKREADAEGNRNDGRALCVRRFQ